MLIFCNLASSVIFYLLFSAISVFVVVEVPCIAPVFDFTIGISAYNMNKWHFKVLTD